jgi:hypothetical protein
MSVAEARDFVPTPREARNNALRLVRSAIMQACKDSVIAGQLELLDGVPTNTLSQEIYKVGLLQLLDIASNAERVHVNEDGDEISRTPDYKARLRAHEILANMRMKEAELLIECQRLGLHAAAEQKPASGVENLLTREEAVAELQRRRREQLHGMR